MNRLVASAFFCAILAAVPSGGGGAYAQEVGALGLGDECNRDRDCEASIVLGRCELGFCACLPFHAAYNRTRCLESKLLGQECTVGEQCALRVANSSCNEGLCKCQEGFLQYHSHTCLGPAKLGHVCYSHAHCKLWDSDTHCDFLIPDLFGRCQCTAPMRQDGEVCRPDRLVQPGNRTLDDQLASVETHRPIEFTTKPPEEEDPGVQLSWLRNATMLLSTVPPTQLMPFNLVTRPSLRAELQPNELPQDDAVVVEAELTELVETTTASTADEAAAAAPLKTDRHESSAFSPVSLGQACAWDAECQLADPHSRCLGGLCDCPRRANGSSPVGCGARRTGCAPGSFQCRGTGACISWFFVCDGRHDCGDGSDEQCSLGDGQTRCPAQAFRCKSSATCVSRAALCDGTRDCPNGEDEAGCSDRRSCPEGAFRCNNGQCLPAYEFCNAVVSCRDGSDEPRGACRTRNRSRLAPRHCPFRCANGRCRSDAITCSGKDGCGDNSDELHCSVCRCPPL